MKCLSVKKSSVCTLFNQKFGCYCMCPSGNNILSLILSIKNNQIQSYLEKGLLSFAFLSAFQNKCQTLDKVKDYRKKVQFGLVMSNKHFTSILPCGFKIRIELIFIKNQTKMFTYFSFQKLFIIKYFCQLTIKCFLSNLFK